MSDTYVSPSLAIQPPPIATAVNNAPAGAVAARSRFIVGPLYDAVFFIASPLLALAMGIFIWANRLSSERIVIWGHEGSPTGIFIGAFTMAHLFIVFFRSNGNKKIFNLYPARFTVVPIALFLVMWGSPWIAIAAGVLATWWDVYHSSLQTFGLGRIYDGRMGNDPQVGRRLDYFLNLLLYAGPILAGTTLVLHTKDFQDFKGVNPPFNLPFLAHLGDFGSTVDSKQRFMTPAIVVGGSLFLVFYLAMYWRYSRQGYKVSLPKVVLMASTGVCSIYTWGFNSFGEAFFIMNFFHAFQYFGIVWWSERKTMTSLFRFESIKWSKTLTIVLFVAIAGFYGIWAESTDAPSIGTALNPAGFNSRFDLNIDTISYYAIIVVSLMHFWYDGFIWSVRKRQV